MTAKEMLAGVLARAVLTNRERESFESMWDQLHRSRKGLSDRQQAWVQKVYFGQKLDREPETPLRRRVVIPTWQNDQPKQRAAALPSSTGTQAPAPVAALAAPPDMFGPGLVKTNAKLIRRKSNSGTFRAVTTPLQSVEGAPEPAASKVGYINYAGVQEERLVTSLMALEEVCPRIEPGSKQYAKIAGFFKRGGVVLKVKPLSEAQVA